MFEITQEILEKTEAHIVELPSDIKFWNIFKRYIVFPLKYLWLGLGEFFKPASLWATISFVLLVAGTLAINKLEFTSEYSLLVFNVSVCLPAILVIFAVPSTYSYSGVKSSHVKITSEFIQKAGVDTIDKVELLEENIQKIFERISSRISFYKWLIGAFWAVYVVLLNVELRVLSLMKERSVEEVLKDNALSFVVAFLATAAALILVVGYKKASELLIKSIEFGCTETKYRLLQKANDTI